MGNSHGLDGGQREGCRLIKRGIVFVFSPGMILCYLQTAVTWSRQMPGVSCYSLFNRSHADCLGHVIIDTVNHCRHSLLSLVPRYIILIQPWGISHGAFTTLSWTDFIFSASIFRPLIMATLNTQTSIPSITIIIILIPRAVCLWCDAILLSGVCVHLQWSLLLKSGGQLATVGGGASSLSALSGGPAEDNSYTLDEQDAAPDKGCRMV